MITFLEFGTPLIYSVRGQSSSSKKSRDTKSAIKACRPSYLNLVGDRLKERPCAPLRTLFPESVTLVPVPRSAPLPTGGIWPSLEICKVIRQISFANNIEPCIVRTSATNPASSAYSAATRTSIQEHLATLQVNQLMFVPTHITLVDDVLTMGRTTWSCAQLLHQIYPNAVIKVFAVIRTQSQGEIDKMLDPVLGTISLNVHNDTVRLP